MAFSKLITVTGDSQSYQLSSAIKKYTLRDLGFEPKPNGSFVYEASLDPTTPFDAVARLKITVNRNLTGFKMDTVNKSGNATINIFKHARAQEFVQQYHFILDEMVARGIFDKI